MDRVPALAADLVRLQVDVIVAIGDPAVEAARQATGTIPILMFAVGDAVGQAWPAPEGTSPGWARCRWS